jgi:hypothetical protein
LTLISSRGLLGPTWQRLALHHTAALGSCCACAPAASPQRHLRCDAPRPRWRGCIRAWAPGTGSWRTRRIRTHLQRLRAPPSWRALGGSALKVRRRCWASSDSWRAWASSFFAILRLGLLSWVLSRSCRAWALPASASVDLLWHTVSSSCIFVQLLLDLIAFVVP